MNIKSLYNPLPQHCIYDQGGEFIGWPFQQVLLRHNIAGHPTTAKNLQANSVCERMHQSIGNALRVLTTLQPPQGIVGANQVLDTAIPNTVFASRALLHSTLKTTPGGLTFHRDMIMDITLIADLQTIQEHRQQLIDNRLIAANRKRFAYDYVIGDEVLKLVYQPTKLAPRAIGP